MKNKLINDTLPLHYSFPLESNGGSPLSVEQEGRRYTLLGSSEKIYSPTSRVKLFLKIAKKTFMTLGAALSNNKVREDWEAFWDGKRTILLYSDSEDLINRICLHRAHQLLLIE